MDHTELPLSKEIVRSSVLEYTPERPPDAPQAQAPFSREDEATNEKKPTKAAAVQCFQAAGRLLNQLPKKGGPICQRK